MKREDFHVGQTVYLLRIQRYKKDAPIESRIIEVKILTVGRKYITVDYWGKMKFDMENNFREKSIYSPEFALYLTRENIYRRVEADNLRISIRRQLECLIENMSFEDLKAIKSIIDKYEDESELKSYQG